MNKIFTGSRIPKTYEITENDIPLEIITFYVSIFNNIQKSGYKIFAKQLYSFSKI